MPQQPVNPAQVEKCLKGIDFPVDKQELIEYATEHGADNNVRQVLNRLPNRNYDNSTIVNQALSELTRGER